MSRLPMALTKRIKEFPECFESKREAAISQSDRRFPFHLL